MPPIPRTGRCWSAPSLRSVLKHALIMFLKRTSMTDNQTLNCEAGETEAWLGGPIPDASFTLTRTSQPLTQEAINVEHAALPLSAEEAWRGPGGARHAGFLLRHIAASHRSSAFRPVIESRALGCFR